MNRRIKSTILNSKAAAITIQKFDVVISKRKLKQKTISRRMANFKSNTPMWIFQDNNLLQNLIHGIQTILKISNPKRNITFIEKILFGSGKNV